MSSICCPETSVTTKLRCVTCKKSKDLIYIAAEAWNHALENIRCFVDADFPLYNVQQQLEAA